jgi:hypothetical protein
MIHSTHILSKPPQGCKPCMEGGFANHPPIVEYFDFEEFKAATLADFIQNSGINEGTAIAHIEFMEEFEYGAGGEVIGTPIHDLLGIKYVRFGNRPNPPLFAAIFKNEDGSIFQIKLNQRWYDSSKGKHGKAYRFPKGSGAGLYTPAVSLAQWVSIADRQRRLADIPRWVDQAVSEGKGDILSGFLDAVELAGDSPEGGYFWNWVRDIPELAIAPTEGVKKTLALISHGVLSLSFNGVTAGYRKEGGLISQIKEFCQPGRVFRLAFDQDEARETIIKSSKAQYKLGKLMEAEGCKVYICLWQNAEGKGIDDAIANLQKSGGDVAAWLQATIDDAPTLTDWSKSQHKARLMRMLLLLNANSQTPERTSEGRYIPTLLDLIARALHVVQSSGTGDGKTTRVGEDWVLRNRANGGFTLVLTSLNSLGQQSAKSWDLPHIHDYDLSDSLQLEVFLTDANQRGGCALCFDSLHRLPEWLLEKVNLVILDEANQGIKHLCEGGTLKERQGDIMKIFAGLLQRTIDNGGSIVAMEVTVYDRTIDFIQKLSGCDSVRVFNHNRSDFIPWDISIVTGSASGFWADLIYALSSGKRLMLAVGAQKAGEKVERVVRRLFPDKKVFRIDSKTNDQGKLNAFWDDPDRFLTEECPDVDLLIYSPSGKAGVSITASGFDEVWGYFTSHYPDMWMQMVGRYRLPVPRKLFIKPFIQAYTGEERIASVRGVRRRIQSNLAGFAKVHGIDQAERMLEMAEAGVDGDRLVTIEGAINEFMAAESAAIGIQKQIAGDYFRHLLTAQGHTLSEESVSKDKEMGDLLTEIQEELWREKAEILAELEEECLKDKSVPTWHKELWGQKERFRLEFPGIDFNDVDDCYHALVEDYGRLSKGVLLQAAAENVGAVQEIESASVRGILGADIRFAHKLPRKAMRAKLIELTGVMVLLDGEKYDNDDRRTQQIKAAALQWRGDIWVWLGLNINESQTPVEVCNKLLHKLGVDPANVGRQGAGRRHHFWQVQGLESPLRNRLLDAARRRLVDALLSPSAVDALLMVREAIDSDDRATIDGVLSIVQELPRSDQQIIKSRLDEGDRRKIFGLSHEMEVAA